ncbi:hypothetical protein, conserved [Eimeria maxima]|uniref:SAC domain-containing protein n=1 Tax=Eimeria maxima TaxID=5804 RepID=U6M3G8_EIMMA|nr:hypothetical protein, conserved [Eimeria maxima]CDJ57603.1 hypothetical protein, conserved [Eimeria maxima]
MATSLQEVVVYDLPNAVCLLALNVQRQKQQQPQQLQEQQQQLSPSAPASTPRDKAIGCCCRCSCYGRLLVFKKTVLDPAEAAAAAAAGSNKGSSSSNSSRSICTDTRRSLSCVAAFQQHCLPTASVFESTRLLLLQQQQKYNSQLQQQRHNTDCLRLLLRPPSSQQQQQQQLGVAAASTLPPGGCAGAIDNNSNNSSSNNSAAARSICGQGTCSCFAAAPVFGLLGAVQLLCGLYLCVATQRSTVGALPDIAAAAAAGAAVAAGAAAAGLDPVPIFALEGVQLIPLFAWKWEGSQQPLHHAAAAAAADAVAVELQRQVFYGGPRVGGCCAPAGVDIGEIRVATATADSSSTSSNRSGYSSPPELIEVQPTHRQQQQQQQNCRLQPQQIAEFRKLLEKEQRLCCLLLSGFSSSPYSLLFSGDIDLTLSLQQQVEHVQQQQRLEQQQQQQQVEARRCKCCSSKHRKLQRGAAGHFVFNKFLLREMQQHLSHAYISAQKKEAVGGAAAAAPAAAAAEAASARPLEGCAPDGVDSNSNNSSSHSSRASSVYDCEGCCCCSSSAAAAPSTGCCFSPWQTVLVQGGLQQQTIAIARGQHKQQQQQMQQQQQQQHDQLGKDLEFLQLSVLARRSRFAAGTRFYSRGLERPADAAAAAADGATAAAAADGRSSPLGVANEVECEQMLWTVLPPQMAIAAAAAAGTRARAAEAAVPAAVTADTLRREPWDSGDTAAAAASAATAAAAAGSASSEWRWRYKPSCASVVFVRGSIPIYWRHESVSRALFSFLMPSPSTCIDLPAAEVYVHLKRHLHWLLHRYQQPLLLLDLVRQQHNVEGTLSSAYRKALFHCSDEFAVSIHSTSDSSSSSTSSSNNSEGSSSNCSNTSSNCSNTNSSSRISSTGSHGTASRSCKLGTRSPSRTVAGTPTSPVEGNAADKNSSEQQQPLLQQQQQKQQLPQVYYYEMDWHVRSESVGFDSAFAELAVLGSKLLQQTGFFLFQQQQQHQHQQEQCQQSVVLQRGVVRFNCIDCLDRTNIAHVCLGVVALYVHLRALGVWMRGTPCPHCCFVLEGRQDVLKATAEGLLLQQTAETRRRHGAILFKEQLLQQQQQELNCSAALIAGAAADHGTTAGIFSPGSQGAGNGLATPAAAAAATATVAALAAPSEELQLPGFDLSCGAAEAGVAAPAGGPQFSVASSPSLPAFKTEAALVAVLGALWRGIGDSISIQYAGSPALHAAEFPPCPTRAAAAVASGRQQTQQQPQTQQQQQPQQPVSATVQRGEMAAATWDGIISGMKDRPWAAQSRTSALYAVQRYVSNKVFDTERQRAIYLLTGVFRPSFQGPDLFSLDCSQQQLPIQTDGGAPGAAARQQSAGSPAATAAAPGKQSPGPAVAALKAGGSNVPPTPAQQAAAEAGEAAAAAAAAVLQRGNHQAFLRFSNFL